jgi:hypothetical protein
MLLQKVKYDSIIAQSTDGPSTGREIAQVAMKVYF